MAYPVTVGPIDHAGGYYGEIAEFYDALRRPVGRRISRPGRTVVVLAEGDPLFYSSYMYLHDRLVDAVPLRDRARGDLGQRLLGRGRECRWCGTRTCSPCCPGRCRCRSWPGGWPTPTPR